MARAGFTSWLDEDAIVQDTVKCTYCSISLEEWSATDDPLKEIFDKKTIFLIEGKNHDLDIVTATEMANR